MADYWTSDLTSGDSSHESKTEASSAPQSQSSVMAASITDSHVLLLLSSGSVIVLRIDTSTLQLVAIPIPEEVVHSIDSAVCACCLSEGPVLLPPTHAPNGHEPSNAPCLLICRQGGEVDMYDIETWRVVGSLTLGGAYMSVVEVRLDAFGPLSSARPDLTDPRPNSVALAPNPFLVLLLSDGTLLVSKSNCWARWLLCRSSESLLFLHNQSTCVQAYASHWHGQMLRFRPFNAWKLPELAPMDHRPRLRRFEGLGEDVAYSGLMVTGPRPCLLVATRHSLVMHPFFVGHNQGGQPTEMAAFTPFHNVNCPFGFVASTGPYQLRDISVLCVGQRRGEQVFMCGAWFSCNRVSITGRCWHPDWAVSLPHAPGQPLAPTEAGSARYPASRRILS